MTNRFRNPTLRAAYDNAVENYRQGHWLRADGTPHRSATYRDAFWGGLLGDRRAPVAGSIAYACYRAGQEMRKESTGRPVYDPRRTA
jgi:hypothetical protein